ncbi:hypothetical protein JTE90_009034 [Oedothorax gibbosus]|uniref:Uncharacterized protein n=1 Tax=Oedothorax gibbosus TaxID=931172 RepID=A0AAV6VL23_9ARAC|nr:hypothetical protein JTE90_009034 [Oedothorax gibbosus]
MIGAEPSDARRILNFLDSSTLGALRKGGSSKRVEIRPPRAPRATTRSERRWNAEADKRVFLDATLRWGRRIMRHRKCGKTTGTTKLTPQKAPQPDHFSMSHHHEAPQNNQQKNVQEIAHITSKKLQHISKGFKDIDGLVPRLG